MTSPDPGAKPNGKASGSGTYHVASQQSWEGNSAPPQVNYVAGGGPPSWLIGLGAALAPAAISALIAVAVVETRLDDLQRQISQATEDRFYGSTFEQFEQRFLERENFVDGRFDRLDRDIERIENQMSRRYFPEKFDGDRPPVFRLQTTEPQQASPSPWSLNNGWIYY